MRGNKFALKASIISSFPNSPTQGCNPNNMKIGTNRKDFGNPPENTE
jgi:hypothetical protein